MNEVASHAKQRSCLDLEAEGPDPQPITEQKLSLADSQGLPKSSSPGSYSLIFTAS